MRALQGGGRQAATARGRSLLSSWPFWSGAASEEERG